tara:strand:- start:742 stop:1431 length:690 start_codon:yes stop_codon:yes gene_type:complete
MEYSSKSVNSNQAGPHEKVGEIVLKHWHSEFKRPIAEHNYLAYQKAKASINRSSIIFDSGCGNGNSTANLAAQYPDSFIIGIDKSLSRLTRNTDNWHRSGQDKNFILVRADLIDFWRLAADDNIKLLRHFILYPNPWPKKQHVKRRWHTSPMLKTIMSLGGQLEVRSNWPVYIDEFSSALSIFHFCSQKKILTLDFAQCLSDFEKKYHQSNHTLWQLTADLSIDSHHHA